MITSLNRDLDQTLRVVTTFFNSENYVSREQNYHRFVEEIARTGVPCLTLECAFGERPFRLAASPAVTTRRTSTVLWQKERLINAAVHELPLGSWKIAWIDADVLFENPSWYQETSRALEDHAVVQLFDSVVRLPRGHKEYRGEGEFHTSFCLEQRNRPGCERLGWFEHGHTGFAWAARREFFDRCGLFDLCLSGSADHMMAHAFVGDFDSKCIDNMVGLGSPLHREFVRWAAEAYRETGGRVGHVPGRILHLWHGDMKDRKYHEHSQEFKQLDFVPSRDLRSAGDGCWEWTGANPALQLWARDLFGDRKEDGD